MCFSLCCGYLPPSSQDPAQLFVKLTGVDVRTARHLLSQADGDAHKAADAFFAAQASSAVPEGEPPLAAALRAELRPLKLGALKKRGRSLGATTEQLEAVDDSDDPKAAAIDLVLALRASLDGMKLGALKKLLRSQGADDDQMEIIDDSDDPKATAIQMIVQADLAGGATAPAAGGSTAPGASGAAVAAVAAEPEPEPEQEPLAATLDKYIAADKQIRLGKGSDAAHSIKVLLGVSDAIIGTYLQQHEAAIEQEFAAHGTAEDKANYRCVLAGTQIPGWACPGISVDSLLAHASAQTAKLGRHHIIALRLYTTSSYSRINDPLRADPPQRPHPFAATTYFISDGIRLLRAVAANRPDAYIERILWRGLKDVGITGQFMTEGGTDYACVSTTASQEVAVLNFAASSLPLVFRIVTKNCINRGADISFLSVFPNEQEFLYPPLTYLHCVKMERETLCGVQLLVATVEPTMV
eukprot:COSAG02_NODE_4633_length_5144_cov_4.775421_3_plen_469_part_00